MERLTIKPGICANASTEYCASQEDCYLCPHGKQMRFSLSDYEDIGMTPSEIMDMKEMFHAYRHICAGVTPERLKELVEADRDGRVIPVVVGDRFYATITGEVMEVTVKRIVMDGEAVRMELTTFLTSVSYHSNIFSKWLFKTREEAEKALEGKR